MKILILGYTGYIGYDIYKKIIKKNFLVKGISKKNKFKKKNHISTSFLNEKKNLYKIVKNFDVIINCFGETKNENLMKKTHILLHEKIVSSVAYYAKKLRKKIHWIQISTLGIYGFDGPGNIKQKINCKTNVAPLSEYEKTKFISEKILQNNSNKFLKFTILRPGTVVSRKNKGIILEKFHKIIQNSIFFYVDTKKTVLNIVHIEDLSNIILKCMNNYKTYGKIYNIAINFKLNNLVLYFERKKSFILKLILPKVFIQIFLIIINFFKKNKIKVHKVNFLIYQRKVSSKPILNDLKYQFKFNIKNICKEFFECAK